jgi:hypothetical protein
VLGVLVTEDNHGFTVRVVVRVVPRTAVIVTLVCEGTALVVIVNVVLVEPAATVTLAGTWAAAVLLLDTVTRAPPAGAAPFSVTVPVELLLPPTTVVGVRVIVDNVAAFTVSVAVRATPNVPVITTDVFAATGVVVTVKVAVLAPAATVTLAGTVAAALLSDSVTTAPPVGALPFSVTVPVEFAPPVTVVGLTVSEVKVAGVTVRVAVCATPRVPVIVT